MSPGAVLKETLPLCILTFHTCITDRVISFEMHKSSVCDSRQSAAEQRMRHLTRYQICLPTVWLVSGWCLAAVCTHCRSMRSPWNHPAAGAVWFPAHRSIGDAVCPWGYRAYFRWTWDPADRLRAKRLSVFHQDSSAVYENLACSSAKLVRITVVWNLLTVCARNYQLLLCNFNWAFGCVIQ